MSSSHFGSRAGSSLESSVLFTLRPTQVGANAPQGMACNPNPRGLVAVIRSPRPASVQWPRIVPNSNRRVVGTSPELPKPWPRGPLERLREEAHAIPTKGCCWRRISRRCGADASRNSGIAAVRDRFPVSTLRSAEGPCSGEHSTMPETPHQLEMWMSDKNADLRSALASKSDPAILSQLADMMSKTAANQLEKRELQKVGQRSDRFARVGEASNPGPPKSQFQRSPVARPCPSALPTTMTSHWFQFWLIQCPPAVGRRLSGFNTRMAEAFDLTIVDSDLSESHCKRRQGAKPLPHPEGVD